MQQAKIKNTFGLVGIVFAFQFFTIGANHNLAKNSQATKIDTLVVFNPFISIFPLYKSDKATDSTILSQSIHKISINEINDVLADKYNLVRNVDTLGWSNLTIELDSLSTSMASKSKKELKQYPQGYHSTLNTSHEYILFMSIRASYDARYPPAAPLQQSMISSQLSRTSMLVIPIGRDKKIGFSINLFLLDNLNKKIIHFNQFVSNDDPRNNQLIKDKIYKMLKPIYYW